MKNYLLPVFACVWVFAAAAAMADVPPPTLARAVTTAQADEEAARARLLKQIRARGYKEKFRKGDIVYCRKETPLGTRFEQSVCLTELQVADRFKKEEEMQQEAKRSSACGSIGCMKE